MWLKLTGIKSEDGGIIQVQEVQDVDHEVSYAISTLYGAISVPESDCARDSYDGKSDT